MGGRIPKSAQKAIDKANRERAENIKRAEFANAALPIPRMMNHLTPRGIANMHEVYFNGELQHLCTLANVDKGVIHRWTHGKGNRPAKDANIEELYGKVEIKRRIRK